MCAEISTFVVDNATKDNEKSIICQMQPIKGGVLTKTFENYLCRNNHVICNHFGSYPPPPEGVIIVIK